MSPAPDWLTVSQIVGRLPGSRGAARVHPATVTRWILAGCPARDGRRVKLAATRAGSRWLVREADLDAFFAALNSVAPAETDAKLPSTTTSRRTASERAAAQLKRLGS